MIGSIHSWASLTSLVGEKLCLSISSSSACYGMLVDLYACIPQEFPVQRLHEAAELKEL
jgi:hypothetical protein